jgi:hypothetical protein
VVWSWIGRPVAQEDLVVGLPASIAKAPWLRRAVSGGVALLTALVILPVPVLASVTFSGSWSAGYFITGSGVNPTPPTPTYSDSVTSNGSHGQTDNLTVDMGTYNQGSPQSDPTKQAFETITLNRNITWSPSGSEKLFGNWVLDAFLNSHAQGIDQVTVLTTNNVVVTNLINPQTYTGSGNTPSEVKKNLLSSLSQSQLAAGNYILQVTVRYQTLANNKVGGQWQTKSGSHAFTFYAQ